VVLVQGGFTLRQAGHTVIAPDLAGLGKDKTPIAEVSLERWTADICRIVDAASEPGRRI